jgi:DNA invertase Pin-like site-specific DNA recombinase
MIIDGYVRVSQVRGRGGDSFISPVVQREQIEAWAALNGSRVGRIFEELDRSGASWDRPLLAEAIDRVERGLSDGIVVAKLDRFGRSLIESLQAIERIRRAGGTFAAVQDGLDLTTETGRLALRIMLSTAEWQHDRIREQWHTARASAISRGVHAGAQAPFGYVRDADTRSLRPHAELGPVVTDLFARRARGASLSELSAHLASARVQTPSGGVRWWSTSLSLILRNRVYLGELHSGDLVNHAAHHPLTDPVTWQAAQAPRRLRPAPHGTPTLLAGLVRCAGCLRPMSIKTIVRGGRRHRAYGCSGGPEDDRCPGRAHISARLLEPYIEAAFFELADAGPDEPDGTIRALEAEAAEAAASLLAYRDDPRILGALGRERFAEGLEARARRERRALLALDASRRRADVVEPVSASTWEGRWPEMTIGERRRAIATVVDCVFVVRGAAPASRRALIARRGDAPVDLPAGERSVATRGPLAAPERGWYRPANVRRHDDACIVRELRAFIGAGPWPDDAVFQAAGRGPLLHEVELSGGPHRWARELRVDPPPVRTRGYWTDERVRQTLTVLVAERNAWPTRRELAALGLDGLHRAMARRGRDEWRRGFGFSAGA